MGFIQSTEKDICCCPRHFIKDFDYLVDRDYNNKVMRINKIIKLQANIRRFLVCLRIFPNKYPHVTKINMDFNTSNIEKNPIIQKLNNLLPKFELSEKETYEINNTNLKLAAFIYPNKSIYKGMVNNLGQKEGFGKLYLQNGSIYKGFFHNNLMSGRGRLMNINGFIYDGEFKQGLSNGYGKYISLDGTTYKGTWSNDKQCGFGDETYADGSHYTGNFDKGKKNGQGKLVFHDMNRYEGNFTDNKIEGEGTYIWKDGRKYIGKWVNNKMHGYGIFHWPDKKRYYGHYKLNLKDGFGMFFWGDGHKFEGFWRNGKQHGYGLIKGVNEEDVEKYGEWMEGKFVLKIESDPLKNKIRALIEYEKSTKEFIEFQVNIERYEKVIFDSAFSQETGPYSNQQNKS